MTKELQSPGAFLALMLEKYNLNPFKLSKDIHLSQSAVRLITIGKTKITTPVAMRLAKYFNTNPEFWLAMQMKWDIAEASKNKDMIKMIKSIPLVSKVPIGARKKPAAAKSAAAKKPAAKAKVAAKKPVAKKPAAKPKAGRKAATAGKSGRAVKTVKK